MARKFIIKEKEIKKLENNYYILTGEEINHIKAMRHIIGDMIIVNNKEYIITKINKENIEVKYIKNEKETGIPDLKVTLYQALVKADKMEYIIQKSVELGVTTIVPVITKNIVIKLDEKDKLKKLERWNKISAEATKQCGRSDIVKVENIIDLKEINYGNNYDYILLAYEKDNTSLRQIIEGIKKEKDNKNLNIAIIIGAEGGFTEEEVEILKNNNYNLKVISLGERILRAETASLNLLSILMYEF